MRDDYHDFQARGAAILAIAPDSAPAFRDYWEEHALPFPGLADPGHRVADRYGQEVRLLRFGRMPALIVLDHAGQIRYRHYGSSMRDIPPNRDLLELLDQLHAEHEATGTAP